MNNRRAVIHRPKLRRDGLSFKTGNAQPQRPDGRLMFSHGAQKCGRAFLSFPAVGENRLILLPKIVTENAMDFDLHRKFLEATVMSTSDLSRATLPEAVEVHSLHPREPVAGFRHVRRRPAGPSEGADQQFLGAVGLRNGLQSDRLKPFLEAPSNGDKKYPPHFDGGLDGKYGSKCKGVPAAQPFGVTFSVPHEDKPSVMTLRMSVGDKRLGTGMNLGMGEPNPAQPVEQVRLRSIAQAVAEAGRNCWQVVKQLAFNPHCASPASRNNSGPEGSRVQSPDPTPYPLDHLPLRGRPENPALITRDETFSYALLENLVGQVASVLLGQGLQKGDRIASWLPKTKLACVLPLAAARAGLVHVPVNPALKRAQVGYILEDSGTRLLVTLPGRVDAFEAGDIPDACHVVLQDDMLTAAATEAPLAASGHDPNDLAAILYTSGSTGRPKGVMLSHANMWLGAVSVAHYLKLQPTDRVLGVLPMSFDYGQNQLLSTWAAGGAVIPLDYMTARDVVNAVDRHDVTTIAGVPPLWIQLCETDWPSKIAGKLKRLTNSGGALTVSLVRKMRSLFLNADLYPMYGLTEAFRSTYLDPSLVDTHPTSMGRAIPFAEVMVVARDGSEAKSNEPGELVHAGPLVAKGYWQDAERTRQRYKPAPDWSAYGGTAVWSGDTVRRDADGLLYFVGRDDEMIKCSGNRISPAELEEVATASGLVAEVAALGVPDERVGQAIVMVVRGDEAQSRGLQQFLRQELPSFMQPSRIEWWPDMPRNPNGKLDRVAIRAMVLKGQSA